MKKTFVPLIVCIATICSCSKKDDISNGVSGLTPFEVNVVERSANQAIITWSESTNLNINNADTVKYKVLINNRIIATNLVIRLDTIENISIDTTYSGRVIAYTSADTISASFSLPKIEEYIAFYGSGNNTFQVYNFHSGVRLWRKGIDYNWYNNGKIGGPTISNDTVFFADTYSHVPNPLLHACNLKTGQVYWTALTGVTQVVAAGTNPVYDKGKLYLMTGNGVVCINSATGQTVWITSVAEGNFGLTPVVNNNIVFAKTPQELLAINALTGAVLWRKFIGNVKRKPALVNDLVIINGGSSIIAYNQQTGAIAWQKSTPAGATWNIALGSGNTIILFIEYSGFYGIDASSGATKWFKSFDWLSSVDVNYTVGDGAVYCYDSYSTPKKLFAFTASNGTILWENTTVPVDASKLVYANKKLYAIQGSTLSGIHGLMNVFDAQTGQYKEVRTLRFSDYIGDYTLKLNDSIYYNPAHGNFK